jgi:hypothetical protein
MTLSFVNDITFEHRRAAVTYCRLVRPKYWPLQLQHYTCCRLQLSPSLISLLKIAGATIKSEDEECQYSYA